MNQDSFVLRGARVIDPANKFDAVADLVVKNGKIYKVSKSRFEVPSSQVTDVEGKWIIPGQIDTHAHVAGISRDVDPSLGYGMLAKAGTTTVVDMGGTGKNMIDGIKRNGAGLNVA
ncbi:MAG: amidohydrolase, partial [SAR202 cluster bacterium]